jgi:hypothetical protein
MADLSSLHTPAKAPDGPSAAREKEGRPQDEGEGAAERAKESLDDARLSATESKALFLPRGAHLLVLLDALGALNLTLLLPALDEVERLLAEEPAGEAKRAALRCLLASLANQDAAKRVHAVTWWTERGPALWAGAQDAVEAVL